MALKQRIKRMLDNFENSALPSAMKQPLILLRKIRGNILNRKASERIARQIRHCNICGWRGEKFNTVYDEIMQQDVEIVCPVCLSEPRQRALFSYLRRKLLTDYLQLMREKNLLCLEICPDRSDPVTRALPTAVYVSIDLDETRAMYPMDVNALGFPDGSFDLVVCSHVLEHVEDDNHALSEIYRVTRQGGTALIQVPIGYYGDPVAEHTEEFGERRFCQHLRSYGWDFPEKLKKTGFNVDIVRFNDVSLKLDNENEVIFACTRPEQKS